MWWWRAYEKAKGIDSAFSLANWAYKALDSLFPAIIAVCVSWAASYSSWIWNDYGMLGVLAVGLCGALLASFAVFLSGLGMRAWRSWKGEGFANEKHIPNSSQTIAVLDREKSFLFLDPPNRELWKAKLRFSRGFEKLQIRLDYSSHCAGVGLGLCGNYLVDIPRHMM